MGSFWYHWLCFYIGTVPTVKQGAENMKNKWIKMSRMMCKLILTFFMILCDASTRDHGFDAMDYFSGLAWTMLTPEYHSNEPVCIEIVIAFLLSRWYFEISSLINLVKIFQLFSNVRQSSEIEQISYFKYSTYLYKYCT